MSVAKRNRRKITVDGQPYVWYVDDNAEAGSYRLPNGDVRLLFLVAHIISDDKKFNVSYAFDQQDLPEPYLPHLLINGSDFPGISESGKWVATPRWDDSNISKRFIHDLIAWCMDENKKIIEVDKYGKPLVDSA